MPRTREGKRLFAETSPSIDHLSARRARQINPIRRHAHRSLPSNETPYGRRNAPQRSPIKFKSASSIQTYQRRRVSAEMLPPHTLHFTPSLLSTSVRLEVLHINFYGQLDSTRFDILLPPLQYTREPSTVLWHTSSAWGASYAAAPPCSFLLLAYCTFANVQRCRNRAAEARKIE